MHLFTVTDKVTKGFHLLRGGHARREGSVQGIEQSTYSSVWLTLGDSIVEDTFTNSLPPGILLLDEARVAFGKTHSLTTIEFEFGSPASRQALVRVTTMAGEGGRVALLPPLRTNFEAGDVKRKYDLFPPPGVQFLGSVDDAEAAHLGTYPTMDALLLLNHGGQFRIERTGDLTDRDGEKFPETFDVRWDGKRRELMMRPGRQAKARPEAWASVPEYTSKADTQAAKAAYLLMADAV